MIPYSVLTALFNYLYLFLAGGIYLLAAFVEPGAGLIIIAFFAIAPIVAIYDIIYLIICFVRRKSLSFAKHRKVYIAAISGAGIILLIQLLLLALFITTVAKSDGSYYKDQRFYSCTKENSVAYCSNKN